MALTSAANRASTTTTRFFAARLAGTTVFDPLGDQVGKVRDVVVVPRPRGMAARAVGFVVEVQARKRVFLPITRITAIEPGQVISSGLLNMRRFEKRASELLVIGDLLERQVTLHDGSGEAVVEDISLERRHAKEWEISKLFLRRKRGGTFGGIVSRSQTLTVEWSGVSGLFGTQAQQSAALLLASYEDLRPADLGEVFQEIEPKRRIELAGELSDERLADVLEELPEDTRVELMTSLEAGRAADVLDAMDPDDAADIVQELPEPVAQQLLDLMEPEEAEDVRRLMAYDEYTAGGMMTTEPLIVSPETPLAHCLAMVSREELSPALASTIYVCRQPLETPTGKLLGMVHFQQLLRDPPDRSVGEILSKDQIRVAPDDSLASVTREMAAYNLVNIPVCDENGLLLGAVTVDDVLDHMLPEDWRESDD